MNSMLKSSALRDMLIFAGLLSGALILSAHFADFASATSLISDDDNISAISDATGGETDFKSLVQTILNYFLGFLGFVATIMVIYGGVLYVTSAGNPENVEKAKKILLYAVVGIVIILLSFAMVNTILGAGASSSSSGGGTSTSI